MNNLQKIYLNTLKRNPIYKVFGKTTAVNLKVNAKKYRKRKIILTNSKISSHDISMYSNVDERTNKRSI
jgi:hypothetical protein